MTANPNTPAAADARVLAELRSRLWAAFYAARKEAEACSNTDSLCMSKVQIEFAQIDYTRFVAKTNTAAAVTPRTDLS